MGSTLKEKSHVKKTTSVEKVSQKKKEKKEKKENKEKKEKKTKPVESKPIEDNEKKEPKEEPKIEKAGDDGADVQDDATVTKKSKKRKAKKTLEQEESKKKVVKKSSDPVTYLRLFQSDRNAWKFNKMHQTWLLKHIYDQDQIEDDDFTILIDYLKGLRGAARDRTLKEAQGKIPAKTTDYDQEIFDAEAALAFVATPAVSSAVSDDDEDENDTVEIKRARALVRALA